MASSHPRRALRGLFLSLAIAVAPGWALAQVQGAGATFPAKVYQRWAQTFEKTPGGTKVNYLASGSGDGIERITARLVQFGATDTPLSAEELRKRRLVQVPLLVGGVVPVVHLPGVAENRLQFNGELLADIMAGRITHWNDARITALNPGLALPVLPIRRVVRADKSGSTEALTRYLALVSPKFKAQVGAGMAPQWPGEVHAAQGNDGMVRELRAVPGSIAYVSHDRAVQDRLATVLLRNAAGRFVAPSESGFRAAILESDLQRRDDDLASLLNRPGGASWPITLASFVLVDAEPATAAQANPALRFIYWCLSQGDRLTQGTGFAPLPMHLQAQLTKRFLGIRPRDGRPLDYLAP